MFVKPPKGASISQTASIGVHFCGNRSSSWGCARSKETSTKEHNLSSRRLKQLGEMQPVSRLDELWHPWQGPSTVKISRVTQILASI